MYTATAMIVQATKAMPSWGRILRDVCTRVSDGLGSLTAFAAPPAARFAGGAAGGDGYGEGGGEAAPPSAMNRQEPLACLAQSVRYLL